MTTDVSGTTNNPNVTSRQADDVQKYSAGIQLQSGGTNINIETAIELVYLQYSQLTQQQTQIKLQETKDNLSVMKQAQLYYAKMKDLKGQAGGSTSKMPQDMKDFLNAHGIEYDHTCNDDMHNKDQWDKNMTYLDSFTQGITDTNKTQLIELNQDVENTNNAQRERATMIGKSSDLMQAVIQATSR